MIRVMPAVMCATSVLAFALGSTGCARIPAEGSAVAGSVTSQTQANAAMGLGYEATCGADVNVYFVWFPPIPGGSHGAFVSYRNPDTSGPPFLVEPMTITAAADQSIVGQSASVSLTANSEGTGAYTLNGLTSANACKVYPHPSGISVGN